MSTRKMEDAGLGIELRDQALSWVIQKRLWSELGTLCNEFKTVIERFDVPHCDEMLEQLDKFRNSIYDMWDKSIIGRLQYGTNESIIENLSAFAIKEVTTTDETTE